MKTKLATTPTRLPAGKARVFGWLGIPVHAALLLAGLLPAAFAQDQMPKETSLVARVGDTGFVKVTADSFHTLDPKQQGLAYWLTQASIAIDPIIYDQLSGYGLREKRLLEVIA